MGMFELIKKRRMIRRFKDSTIPFLQLEKLIDAARVAPSAANYQPLEYLVIDEKELCEKIFPHTRWAGYIAPAGIPPEGKRPTVYILVIRNKEKNDKYGSYDAGAAIENILLTAWEMEIGGCWIQNFDKEALRDLLKVPAHCELDSIVALGYRDEEPVLEVVTDSIKYWKDEKGVLHVPKRRVVDILHHNRY